MITVVNQKTIRGTGVQGIYIGRRHPEFETASPLANPFRIGADGARAEVIEKYRRWLWKVIRDRQGAAYRELLRLAELALKEDLVLTCWCAPQACHGDVLIRAIEFMNSRIFVFGSNLAGRHGKGAALHARSYYGAIYGQGVGFQGRSYAIPTKDHDLRTLPLPEIARHVAVFLTFASERERLTFTVTRVGCGLAGYRDATIAPLFEAAPGNCHLPAEWSEFVKAAA